jgi:hypothetical protein
MVGVDASRRVALCAPVQSLGVSSAALRKLGNFVPALATGALSAAFLSILQSRSCGHLEVIVEVTVVRHRSVDDSKAVVVHRILLELGKYETAFLYQTIAEGVLVVQR